MRRARRCHYLYFNCDDPFTDVLEGVTGVVIGAVGDGPGDDECDEEALPLGAHPATAPPLRAHRRLRHGGRRSATSAPWHGRSPQSPLLALRPAMRDGGRGGVRLQEGGGSLSGGRLGLISTQPQTVTEIRCPTIIPGAVATVGRRRSGKCVGAKRRSGRRFSVSNPCKHRHEAPMGGDAPNVKILVGRGGDKSMMQMRRLLEPEPFENIIFCAEGGFFYKNQ